MTNRKNAVEELIAEGVASIEESFRMAKAAQPDGEQPKDEGDLDGDFKDFDESRKASDAAEQDEDEEETGEGEGDNDANPQGQEGDGESEGDPDANSDDKPDRNGGKPGEGKMAKADGGYVEVDATEILASIDASLTGMVERITKLESSNADLARSNATLAKALQATASGQMTMAKAMQTAMGQPLTPKTRAVVPIREAQPAAQVSGQNRKTVMAKALQACDEGRISIEDVGTLEILTNASGIDNALAQLPRVAEEINNTGGGK
jgi:hypothetical protein